MIESDINNYNILNNLSDIDVLEQEITKIDKILLSDDKKYNDKNISDILHKFRKEILKNEIQLNQIELSFAHVNNNQITEYKNKLQLLINNLKLLDEYHTKIIQYNQKKSIDTLTLVNTIFLPLSLIAGYFGMNFKSMGIPSSSKGIFNIANGQIFVVSLFLIITVAVIILFKYQLIPTIV